MVTLILVGKDQFPQLVGINIIKSCPILPRKHMVWGVKGWQGFAYLMCECDLRGNAGVSMWVIEGYSHG